MDTSDELLMFFGSLADQTRLKIVGVLAQRPCSGEELAAIVALKPATITHHLHKLMGRRIGDGGTPRPCQGLPSAHGYHPCHGKAPASRQSPGARAR